MRIEQLLRTIARADGAKPALVSGRLTYTYADIDRKSDRLAAAMLAHGLVAGNRVAVFLDHSVAAVVSTFALLKAGIVVCPVEPGCDADALKILFQRGRLSGVVTETRLAATTAAVLAAAPDIRLLILVNGDRESVPAGCLSYERVTEGPGPDTLALIEGAHAPAVIFGAAAPDGRLPSPVSHASLVAAAGTEPGEAETIIADVGLTTRFGFSRMLAAVAAGATQVIPGPARAPFRGRRDGDAPGLAMALAG